ncbi:MAG: M28 family metallopeptidase [Candidatus Aminicenantes bacterium]|nr:M28 family metallopeptidase [Candidatus Aminicenantes bacterium]
MTTKRLFALLLLGSAGLLGLLGFGAASTEAVLVRIEFASLPLVPPDIRPGLFAVAELQDAWLAVLPEETALRLADAGVGLEILDAQPAKKAYFLVRVRGQGDWPVLERLGRTVRLDAATALFWAGDREAREILPADFEIARVFLDTAIPLREAGGPAALLPALPARALDPAIVQLVAQVSQARLTATISDLEGFRTRYASTAACESAGAYLYDAFSRLGLRTEYDPFIFSSYATRNIVATLPGRVEPNREIIVCGHYDSTSNQRTTLAPGADDNGSGTAAVLEIARVLAGSAFDYTVKFICFSAEEWGLYGSQHYAAAAQAAGEVILAVINMDMIAFPDRSPWMLDIVRNTPSADLARHFVAAASAYAGLTVNTVAVSSWPYSDQSPFWNAGYAALCAIENEEPGNPYYHKTTDTLSTLTMGYALRTVQASLATTAELARPASTPVSPSGVVVRSRISRSLYIRTKTVGLRWNANSDAVVGYHVYRTTTPGGPYERLTTAPQTATEIMDRFLDAGVTYYYAVSAVDAQGRESRYSIEVADSEATWN